MEQTTHTSHNLEYETKDCNVQFSSLMNLLIIKGKLSSQIIRERFGSLKQKLNKHFEESETLNIYLNLDVQDMRVSNYFLELAHLLNKKKSDGKKVKIYWREQQDLYSQRLEQEYKKLLNCDFQLCNI